MELYSEEFDNKKYLELESLLEQELPALINELKELKVQVTLEDDLRKEAESYGNLPSSISVARH